ncbi:uncharacterized protein [Amphiura filiformis]|uniref:uncharacterized protein n=1 Tax=Amphiura filiformis TaxID=82378 RepID=UPI003B20B9C5
MAVFSLGVIVVVVIIAALFQMEVDYEPLIAEKTVVVQASNVDSFKVVADVPNFDKWINFITKVNEMDNSRVGVGKSFEVHVHFPFIGENQYRLDITNYGPPKSLSFDADFELLLPRTIVEIKDGDMLGVSKITWRLYSKRRSYLFCGTVLPISRFIMTKQLQGALFRLKLQISHSL